MNPILIIMGGLALVGAVIAWAMPWRFAWRLWVVILLIALALVLWSSFGPPNQWALIFNTILAGWGLAFSAPFILRALVLAIQAMRRDPKKPAPLETPLSRWAGLSLGALNLLLALSAIAVASLGAILAMGLET